MFKSKKYSVYECVYKNAYMRISQYKYIKRTEDTHHSVTVTVVSGCMRESQMISTFFFALLYFLRFSW